jgi:hypothetical protein
MSFRGSFQYVEVAVDPSERMVAIRALDERAAANPKTKIGVIVDMDNAIDRLIIIGDDAYDIGKMSDKPCVAIDPWDLSGLEDWPNSEGFGVYDIDKKPDGTADMILELLNLKEK